MTSTLLYTVIHETIGLNTINDKDDLKVNDQVLIC